MKLRPLAQTRPAHAQTIRVIIGRSVLLTIIIGCVVRLLHDFNQMIAGLALACVYFFVVLDPENLLLYSRFIRNRSNFLFGLVRSNHDIPLDRIEHIEVRGDYGHPKWWALTSLLHYVLPTNNNLHLNQLVLHLHSGKTLSWDNHVPLPQLEAFAEQVRNQMKAHSEEKETK